MYSPPLDWMSPGCYRVAGFSGYPDIYYSGPEADVLGNAQEYPSTDGTCTATPARMSQPSYEVPTSQRPLNSVS